METSTQHKIQAMLLWYKQRGLITPSYTELSNKLETSTEAAEQSDTPEAIKVNRLVVNYLEGNTKNPSILFVTSNEKLENSFNPDELELFNKMLKAIQLSITENVAVINIKKTDDATDHSIEFNEIVESKEPKLIVILDSASLELVYHRNQDAIMQWNDLRGKWLELDINKKSIKLMATWHPRALLKHPPLKREAWGDLQEIQKYISNI